MIKRKKKYCIACFAGILFVIWGMMLAGCAPQSNNHEGIAKAGSSTLSSSIMEVNPYAPVVKEVDDGILIQRTPSENIEATEEGTAAFHHPTENVPYNTYFLNADARGCGACHSNLVKTLETMPYEHPGISSGLGIETTVQQCLDCHVPESTAETVVNSFGSIMHGIHETNNRANCMNCHDAFEDNTADPSNILGKNSGMPLWDAVKHQKLRGIIDISDSDMGDNFTSTQEKTFPASALPDIRWQYSASDYERIANVDSDEPLNEQMFEEWTITVSGEVDNEKTWTLSELIEQAPNESFPIKVNCHVNGVGGALVGQVMVTGIPLSWLLEQAGIKDSAKSITTNSPDGAFSMFNLEQHANNKSCIVYEMDGERLSWSNGYPAVFMMGGTAAATNTKQLTDIIVSAEEVIEEPAYMDKNGVYYNCPNIGLFDLREGQIVQTGEVLQLHGYADAFDKYVSAVEVSMDRGETWKRFDVESPNNDQLITWTYDFIPEIDGAYCFYLRAVTEEGIVTADSLEKMIIAKSDVLEVD